MPKSSSADLPALFPIVNGRVFKCVSHWHVKSFVGVVPLIIVKFTKNTKKNRKHDQHGHRGTPPWRQQPPSCKRKWRPFCLHAPFPEKVGFWGAHQNTPSANERKQTTPTRSWSEKSTSVVRSKRLEKTIRPYGHPPPPPNK